VEAFCQMKPPNNSGHIADTELIYWNKLLILHAKCKSILRLLNLRLDVVVKDVTGLTGLSIIDAICKGEMNPEKLASLPTWEL
jgi:hypothetical protein